jgi:NDP-sugar pyrophosphorylase family protein
MHDELQRLASALCTAAPASDIPEAEIAAFIRECVVTLPAGGFGYRMRDVAVEAGGVTQKALLPVPGGETLIGRLIRQYAQAGFRRFVALVNHEGGAVEAHLNRGRAWGVEVRASYDPEPTGSGRTGALAHAMAIGILPADGPVVVHNADCHLMHYPGIFPRDLVEAHLQAVRRGEVRATLAAVGGTRYPYTGMQIREGTVTGVEMYPFIPVPTHTGITILTPAGLQDIRENLTKSKQNFERDLFPRWSADGHLAAMVIGHEHWIAVDDRKAYRIFCRAVAEEL